MKLDPIGLQSIWKGYSLDCSYCGVFKQRVNRHANKLNSSKSKIQLKKLHASTESIIEKCLQKLLASEKPQERFFDYLAGLVAL